MIIYQFENIGKAYDYKHNCHSNWYVPHHLHEFSEFVFVEKGVFYMHIDGIKYTVPENHLIFVGPNQLHDSPGIWWMTPPGSWGVLGKNCPNTLCMG